MRILLSFAMVCHAALVFAQHPYYITNYKKTEYLAANQNWDIALDDAGNVFMANNKGLLVLSEGSFRLVELPDKSIIRSVACLNGKVYCGSFEEFGFWEYGDQDGWVFTSLIGLLKDDQLENDEIWKIIPFHDKIYFQSFGKILSYKDNAITSIPLPGSVLFIMEADNRLFVQQIQGGLYELIDQELHFIHGSNYFSDTEIRSILGFDDGGFLIATSSKGLYKWDGSDFSKWENEASIQLSGSKINNGLKLNDCFVFGTILKGVYIIDAEGNLLYNIHTGNGLQNNTVLAITSDNSGNLWIGLDKGIDYVAFDTPMHFYNIDEQGSGAVYTAAFFKNHLYIGTNQGVYYYSLSDKGTFVNKRFVQGSQGQAWLLKEIDGHLYCGLNHGTFIMDNNRIEQVGFVDGGYNLKKISIHDEDFLIQSTYNSVVLYKKTDGIWNQHRIVHGFNAPARLLERDHIGNIWLGHTISGLYILQPNPSYDSAVSITRIKSEYEPTANLNKVFKVDNRIVVATGNQLLQWDAIKNQLVPYSELATQLEGFDAATNIVAVPGDKYWFVKKNEIAMFGIRFGTANLLYRIIPKMFGLKMVEDYENIVALNDSLYLFCLENGFTILNLNTLEQMPDDNTPPAISRIELWKNPDKIIHVAVSSLKKQEFKHVMNNVNFYITAIGEVGKKKHFQYRLLGLEDDWSDWTQSNIITYTRLPHGNYTFQVKTLTSKGILTRATDFRLRIKPPWHFTWYAYSLYVILFMTMALLIRIYHLRRKWKQQELVMKHEQQEITRLKEKAEKEVIRLNNEKLQSEITHINIQLANNTMAIIRKNDLLSEIREELIRQKEELGQRLPSKYFTRLNKMLEQGISNDHDWELFEKLFDQAHENFFQQLKNNFPGLTTSDLRLCAYLRLNLTSKEISPLLNITIRGVEERRYRLRKRLKLASDQNLTEFIISF